MGHQQGDGTKIAIQLDGIRRRRVDATTRPRLQADYKDNSEQRRSACGDGLVRLQCNLPNIHLGLPGAQSAVRFVTFCIRSHCLGPGDFRRYARTFSLRCHS